jgi:hypothetical protein
MTGIGSRSGVVERERRPGGYAEVPPQRDVKRELYREKYHGKTDQGVVAAGGGCLADRQLEWE